MDVMMKQQNTIWVGACILLACISMLFANEPNVPSDPDPALWAQGEDGSWYCRRPWEIKTDWLMGKIHPDLAALEPGVGILEIKLELTNQPLAKLAKQTRKRRGQEIRQFENELKGLVVESVSDISYVTREEEIEAIPDSKVPDQVREHMKVLHQEIERVQNEISDEIITQAIEAVNPDQQTVVDLVTQLGGEVTAGSAMANVLGAVFTVWDENTLTTLAESPLIKSITPDCKLELDLNVSADMLGADSFWDAGYDGGIWDFGLCDSGVRDTHIYLNTHDIYKRYTSVDNHGTSVAGIVGSTHPTYQGIAFGMDKIINGSGHNSMPESECMENQDWVIDTTQHGSDGPEVINNSYSLYGHTDEYGPFERYMDSIVDDLNISVTKSAGNRGPGYGGLQQLGYPQSHNLISVANLDINDTLTTTDDVITHIYSSRGPTDDNRRKPDIAAPGTGTATTTDTSDTAMTMTFGGTSAAAPHVAAACLLLRDYGVSSAMAQKAILINTANTWTSNGTPDNYTDDGPENGDHWDPAYGWGVLDIDHAYTHRSDYFSDSVIGRNDNATEDDYKLYKGTMYANDKVTLVWHRRAVWNGDQAPTTYYSLTNLNMRLYDEDNNDMVDYDWDDNDNVHQVSVSSTTDAVIKVYNLDYTIYGQSSEPFVIATEEGFSAVDPPDFYVNYSRPNYVGPYQTFNVTVRLFNNGGVTSHDNSLTLTDISYVTVDGDNTHSLPSVESGGGVQETVYSFTTNGPAAGTHWLPVSAESNCYAETYTYSRTNGVSIIVERDAPVTDCTSPTYTNSSPIAVNWTASDAGCGLGTTYLYVKEPGATNYSYSGLYSAGSGGTFNYSPEGNGTYYFAVRGVDAGGNWEPVPTSADDSTIYDTIAPWSNLSSPAAVAGGAITLTYSSGDYYPGSGVERVYFYYKKGLDDSWHFIQNSTIEDGTINWTPTGGSGTYYFSMKAKDNADNYQYGLGYPPAPTARTVYGSPCGGDCNGDGSCNFADLARMGENWLSIGCSYPLRCGGADLNANGNVDIYDFRYVLRNYNCTP